MRSISIHPSPATSCAALLTALAVAACHDRPHAVDSSTGCASECEDTGEPTTSGEPTGTGSDSGGESGTTGDAPPTCTLPGAPPPIATSGVLLVPIDITSVTAELRFDLEVDEIHGTAVVDFRAGELKGLPLFDLRQPIVRAVLDGEELAADDIVAFEPPAEDATMQVVQRLLAPCSEHRLELEYRVERLPWDSQSFVINPESVFWSTHLFDYPGHRFAEKWFPSNLIHDTLDMTVDILVENGSSEHALIANATTTKLKTNHWRVFYEDATSMSPLIELCPEPSARTASAEVELAGAQVAVDLWHCFAAPGGDHPDPEDHVEDVVAALEFAAGELGPYPHGARFTGVLLSQGIYSMEYPGGMVTHTFAIKHEVFHSWIARGVRPLTQRDAWFDEAWTAHAVNGYDGWELTFDDPPEELAGENLWVRSFPGLSDTPPRVFATIRAEVGVAAFRQILRDIYTAHADRAITTETLERELHCRVGTDLVRRVFHRFVYGRSGEPEAAPADYCALVADVVVHVGEMARFL